MMSSVRSRFGAPLSALIVPGPATPSALRPADFWNALTASVTLSSKTSGFDPAATFRRSRSAATRVSVMPGFSVGPSGMRTTFSGSPVRLRTSASFALSAL